MLRAPKSIWYGETDALSAQFCIGIAHIVGGADGLVLWHNEIALALALMAVAGISDALDGALARRYNWQSHLGSILDPLADKFLVAITFLVFTFKVVPYGWQL